MYRYQTAALVAFLAAAGAAPLAGRQAPRVSDAAPHQRTEVNRYRAGNTASPAVQENAAVAELTRLEAVWNDAHLKADAQALDALIADDAVIIVPGMTPMTKQQSLGMLKQGVMKFTRYQTSEIKVRTYETAAIVSGALTRTRSAGARSGDDNWLFTKSYVQRTGKWIVVAFTAAPAPSSASK